MFFIETEESVVTREELLKKPENHKEFFTSIVCNDENGKQEFVSGVSIVQEKWNPRNFYRDIPRSMVMVDFIRERLCELVDAPEDMEVIYKVIERAIENWKEENEENVELLGELKTDLGFYEEDISYEVIESLTQLYVQEYARLIWSGSVCSSVTTVHFITDVCLEERFKKAPLISAELVVTSDWQLKREVEHYIFYRFSDRKWNRMWDSVDTAFRCEMMKFPETQSIIALEEYFSVMAYRMEDKKTYGSGRQEETRFMVSIEFLETLETFGKQLRGMSRMSHYHAACALESIEQMEAERSHELDRIQQLREAGELESVQRMLAESRWITDPELETLALEALSALKQNKTILKKYFVIWDAYVKNVMCNEQMTTAYINNTNYDELVTPISENPWQE